MTINAIIFEPAKSVPRKCIHVPGVSVQTVSVSITVSVACPLIALLHGVLLHTLYLQLCTAYSHFVDSEMTKPGHNYLPLGPSFQEHVTCFFKYVSLNVTVWNNTK